MKPYELFPMFIKKPENLPGGVWSENMMCPKCEEIDPKAICLDGIMCCEQCHYKLEPVKPGKPIPCKDALKLSRKILEDAELARDEMRYLQCAKCGVRSRDVRYLYDHDDEAYCPDCSITMIIGEDEPECTHDPRWISQEIAWCPQCGAYRKAGGQWVLPEKGI